MSVVRLHYGIVYVRNMERSIQFYRDAIGLPLRFATADWSELRAGAVSIALHRATDALDPGEPAAAPRPGSCHPGLRVTDLDHFHARMVDRDVRCIDEPAIRFGVRIARYVDPDGLLLAVSEAPGMNAARPSRRT
jgi:catechol 2,3-dioxygenase-like lactoylglutathione lyase family enzyme